MQLGQQRSQQQQQKQKQTSLALVTSLTRLASLTWLTSLTGVMTLMAATAGAQPAPAAVNEPTHEHRVASGDTLIGLGRRLLLDARRWPELARVNRLANPNRLQPGQLLQVPLSLMASEPVPASVVSVTGSASLQAGQPLPEGGQVSTGADGHVTLRLVDGSVLRLRPGSLLELRESRRVPAASAVRSGATLRRGRVEVEAEPAAAGKPGFRIDTPQGVLAVRGTEFRVATGGDGTRDGDGSGAGASAGDGTRGEVLTGAVAVAGRAAVTGAPTAATSASTASGARLVTAGFGTTISPDGQVAVPSPLLPALDLSALPPLQERLLLRFALPAQPGAVAYRAQIARDSNFDAVVAERTSPTPELRFAELPDGDYVLRVRGIDARGFEGRDADWRFKLKARPEPPLPSAPAPRATVTASATGGQVDFAWAANAQAQRYRLQVASDAAFTRIVHDLADLPGTTTAIDGLAPGSYWWRLASVRDIGGSGGGGGGGNTTVDRGPWGDGRSFDVKPPPPSPPAVRPPQVGDDTVAFGWDARPGQRVEIQIARDGAFSQRVFERTLSAPGVEWTPSGSGRFHVRLRSIDADGYIGPWSTPQTLDLPACLRDSQGSCVRSGDATLDLQRD